nr:zinc finger, CCHC-type, retrotransposon Gag domain protein [Tanacetum cinerariifolium]
MVSEPGFEIVGYKDLSCEDWTLLPQIHVKIHEEFRTSSGPSDSGGNPPPVTIYTWLECFNKQKPRSFEKVTAPVDTENWISHMEKIFDVMGCEDAFKTRLAVYKFEGNTLAWRKAYKQAKDRRGDSDNHRSSKNNYSGNNNMLNFKSIRSSSIHNHDPNITVSSSPGVPLRLLLPGLHYKDCKKNTTVSTSGQADKKPGASGRVFAITEDHATKTSGKSMQIISALQARTLLSHGCEGFLATIHDTTSDVPSIHDQPIVSEVEFSIELIPGAEPSQRLLTAWLR